ncbi:MAG TPA: sporulation protein YabP [Acholeplasmataceae bacterium]|nr:sporulation protein YabP [Acholeplasmataceae bacterium]
MNDITSQEIILRNRKDLEITGVKRLYSLNETQFIVETTLGKMKIGGTNLEMQQLDIAKGILLITGTISLIEYSDNIKVKKDGSSFIAKLFK